MSTVSGNTLPADTARRTCTASTNTGRSIFRPLATSHQKSDSGDRSTKAVRAGFGKAQSEETDMEPSVCETGRSEHTVSLIKLHTDLSLMGWLSCTHATGLFASIRLISRLAQARRILLTPLARVDAFREARITTPSSLRFKSSTCGIDTRRVGSHKRNLPLSSESATPSSVSLSLGRPGSTSRAEVGVAF